MIKINKELELYLRIEKLFNIRLEELEHFMTEDKNGLLQREEEISYLRRKINKEFGLYNQSFITKEVI